MRTSLYVTCAADRETLKLPDLPDHLGDRFPTGAPRMAENLPRRDSRLPWARAPLVQLDRERR